MNCTNYRKISKSGKRASMERENKNVELVYVKLTCLNFEAKPTLPYGAVGAEGWALLLRHHAGIYLNSNLRVMTLHIKA